MKIEEIKKQLEKGNVAFHGKCHDCGKEVTILCTVNEKGEIRISGGAVYNPKVGTVFDEQMFFKCDACFQKDPTLRNWNPCSVYSRVVGYLRPVEGWNLGKKEEFKNRKEFVMGKK